MPIAATALEFAEVQVAPVLAVQLSGHCPTDPASIAQALRSAFEDLTTFVTAHGLARNGHPRTIYTGYDAAGLSFTVAFPVAAGSREPLEQTQVSLGTLPAVSAYRFTHHGPYVNLAQTYGQITAFLKERGFLKSDADWARYMPMWEEYCNDPGATTPADLLTYIYLPA